MKTTQYLVALFAFVAAMLIGCADEQQSPVTSVAPNNGDPLQKVIIIPHTGHDWPIGLIDPGTVRLEGGMRITQHMIVLCRLVTTNSLITGDMVLDLCSRLDNQTGEGHVNGLATVTPDDVNVGGTWHFSFQGQTTKTGESEWTTVAEIVGNGQGGIIQSRQVKYNDRLIAWDSPATFWLGTGEGYMKYNEN